MSATEQGYKTPPGSPEESYDETTPTTDTQEILNKEMKEKEDFIKKLMEENEKLKQKESNVVLEENIVIEDYAMTKIIFLF